MKILNRRKTVLGVFSILAVMGGVLSPPGLPEASATENTAGPAGFDANDDLNGEAFFTDEVLAVGGEDGYDCYRIPSLGVAKDGTVLASWDGRPGGCADAPQANTVVQRRSDDNGLSWTAPQAVAAGQVNAPKYGFSDPSVLVDYHTGDVFNFHVKSFDAGIRNSRLGTDPNDRNVLHAAYAKSSDNGVTWDDDNVITHSVTGDNAWRGRFATSGNGIQLQYGAHAGRLVQPAMVVTTSGQFKAIAWLSDDHGQTWYAGHPFGTGMDENKIIELSDGTLMDNSRSSAGGEQARKISFSHDGGVTWTEPYLDHSLPDPHNNASLIRLFPNAPEGSPKAKALLFSNTASTSSRSNGTIRLSCDDGKTWPVSRSFRAGNIQYTSMATLPDGNIGLLFEEHNHGPHNNIHFSRFNLEWLGASCLDIQTEASQVRPGETVTVTGTVTNTLGDDIVDRPLEIVLPAGWTGEAPNVTVAAGDTQEVSFEVTAPADAPNGTVEGTLRIDDAGVVKQDTFSIEVVDGHVLSAGDVSITASVKNPGEDFVEGSKIHYNFRVDNPHPTPVGVLPSGELELFDPDTSPHKSCRWNRFNGNTVADCGFPEHTVTGEDIQRGYYEPTVSWRIGRPGHGGDPYKIITMTLPRVTFGDEGQITENHADLSIEPIAPVQATGGPVDFTAVVTVEMREEDAEIPEDARIALYVDTVKAGEADVTAEGTASIPFTVPNVPSGSDSVTHQLRARLVATAAPGVQLLSRDAQGSATVTPEDRPVVERTVTLGEQPDIVSDGQPRSIPLSARVSGPDGTVAGIPVVFSVDGETVAESTTNMDGLAVVRYTVDSIATGGPERNVNVSAAIEESSDSTTDYPAASDTGSFNVLPVPSPEPPETVTSTVTTTVTSTTTTTEPATTVTETPDPVTSTVTEAPDPVTETSTTTVTETPDPLTETSTTTVTETPDPVTSTETTTQVPAPVTVTATATETEMVTITETPEPITVTETQEPVTETVTSTPDPVTEVVTETQDPVTETITPAPSTATVTETSTAAPVTETVVETSAPVTVTVTATPTETPDDGGNENAIVAGAVGVGAAVAVISGIAALIRYLPWFYELGNFNWLFNLIGR
ncbi:exo-alpha-sialidase [Corynebacterium pygosceleis]|uniref:exo-alpha-sialidase n=1 Tax=Corynebacterium pygosceleis TaxID=2800406 RepID=A0A9Q4GKV9_9CORY|nr:exo-alpha-sialidase [Corynebacterium pygosceleis]MCK7637012.1 exo-alpha-sialidase [Corynebacterium pygosceleis]MCK7674486.1 exo-alpha-sialidase [Corynebacterium pygosceleis]MCL0120216.1 exo-alpha-sialidase [Corynebacterium pygosceleis]MCX7467765.1 exo-alpha-sialidase [Corynebacterium pygosceleis]